MKKNELNDVQLDRLLKFASQPNPSADFELRLLQKIQTDVRPSNVVAFPHQRKSLFWLAGLPLAASLLIGIWFGANDTLSDFLPFGNDDLNLNVAGLLSSADTNDDVDNFTEDTQS